MNIKLFSIIAIMCILLVQFIGTGKVVLAGTIQNDEGVILDDIDIAVGESVYYSEHTQTFFVDESSARWGGLNNYQINNLKEWVNFLNQDPERVRQTLEYGGYFEQNNSSMQARALPPAVVKALIAIGKGALTAVGGAIAKYGLQGACSRIGYQYQPFRDFCRANGWPVYGGGGRG